MMISGSGFHSCDVACTLGVVPLGVSGRSIMRWRTCALSVAIFLTKYLLIGKTSLTVRGSFKLKSVKIFLLHWLSASGCTTETWLRSSSWEHFAFFKHHRIWCKLGWRFCVNLGESARFRRTSPAIFELVMHGFCGRTPIFKSKTLFGSRPWRTTELAPNTRVEGGVVS